MTMRIAFRTDATLLMGSGHVMRCLTLADVLETQGVECHFISREHPGHMLDLIRQRGFPVAVLSTELPQPTKSSQVTIDPVDQPTHAPWLGCDWQTDARQTGVILARLQSDWLVVDHYALDQRWEAALRPHYQKLLVIDDLADRPHHCDLLLDQNLGRRSQDYAGLVPAHCKVLIGPEYALLRPEFAALRPYSLQRRERPTLKHLLITMGGVDLPNATVQVLQALKSCVLPQDCRISVVLGRQAPSLQQVREVGQNMPWPTQVLVNITDMAQRMADSDLAIGAAGSTSWERCCLGLPTIIVVLADNQRSGARALQAVQAAHLIDSVSEIGAQLPRAVQALTQDLRVIQHSAAASAVTDGQGADRTLRAMGVLLDYANCG